MRLKTNNNETAVFMFVLGDLVKKKKHQEEAFILMRINDKLTIWIWWFYLALRILTRHITCTNWIIKDVLLSTFLYHHSGQHKSGGGHWSATAAAVDDRRAAAVHHRWYARLRSLQGVAGRARRAFRQLIQHCDNRLEAFRWPHDGKCTGWTGYCGVCGV